MAADVPLVELAGHGDAYRRWAPRRRSGRRRTPSDLDDVRAQGAVGFVQRALGVQVKVGIGKLRAEAVGVFEFHFAGRPTGGRASGRAAGSPFSSGAKEALRVRLSMGQRWPPTTTSADSACGRNARTSQRAWPLLLPHAVRAEDAESVAVISADYRFDIFSSHESLIVKYGRFLAGNAQSRAACAPGGLGRARNAARTGPRARRSKSSARSTVMPISTAF